MLSIQMTFDQLLDAISQLNSQERLIVKRILESDVDIKRARQQLRGALEETWKMTDKFTEEEVIADVEAALQEVRKGQ